MTAARRRHRHRAQVVAPRTRPPRRVARVGDMAERCRCRRRRMRKSITRQLSSVPSAKCSTLQSPQKRRWVPCDSTRNRNTSTRSPRFLNTPLRYTFRSESSHGVRVERPTARVAACTVDGVAAKCSMVTTAERRASEQVASHQSRAAGARRNSHFTVFNYGFLQRRASVPATSPVQPCGD